MDRTKPWIAAHMKKLMAAKPIGKIRVTELCRAAGITPPTFYYHFQDKYDLLAWMFFQAAFETDLLSVASAADGLNQMRSDYVFYKRIYEDPSQNPMWAYMLEHFVSKHIELAKDRLHTDVLDPQLQYSIRLYCYGTLGMTREWLLKDNITPAATVVRMMFASMPENMRTVFF